MVGATEEISQHAPAAAGPNEVEDRAIDMGFAWAIIRGAVFGILAFTGLIFGGIRLFAPEMSPGAAFGVAAWTGIWGGLFLGGTVSVGLWSHHRHAKP
ncbi:MAG: hypothetical protein N2037_11315 [Acidimicrobiales bacterium]|nr:hypothetical protein [Acidimicrobiales bacterium]